MQNKLIFKIVIYFMIASMLLSTILFTVNLFM
ncbi:stressosome-associated protein Prli42 [Paenibacillus cremeus]|nr:stressosome-associated protein Prli42 [Paenibacillus cremeus]